MAWEERYGAIWHSPTNEGDVVLQEHFLSDHDLVTLVVQRKDRLLEVSVLRKVPDRQWRLPFWAPIEAPAIVQTVEDARCYLASTIALHCDHE